MPETRIRVVHRTCVLLLLAALVGATAQAQESAPPWADWRSLETPHYRVHYPLPWEDWARHAAARMEAIRTAVIEEVGYVPPERVDVLVADPEAAPNGSAWPFLGSPRLILWTTPPTPESGLGQYLDWSEILVVHEEAHLVHLLRPSRNPARQALARALPLGPLAISAPRWVTEGYATVVEGRLTGSGRPNGNLRAAVLRQWARAGKLPSYGQLSAANDTWFSGSMAYLAGSAYLEWLEARAGAGSLKKLWARMSARESRSFEQSFEGVFGDSPQDLWDRYRVELSARAIRFEDELSPSRREGELFQDLARTVGAPAVSPDGSLVAVARTFVDAPAELTVWETAPDLEAEKKNEKKRAEILAKDPEDVLAVRTGPLAKKPRFRLLGRDGLAPTMPRFEPSGASILFVQWTPDAAGARHPDLFRWTFASGTVERLTFGADLRSADPAPDGKSAFAVRSRFGKTAIVTVNLASKEIHEITTPSIETPVDAPRVSPDGREVAFARLDPIGGIWTIVIRDLATGIEHVLAPEPPASYASPAWSDDGREILAVWMREGRFDVVALDCQGTSGPRLVTSTLGAAFAPAPTPERNGERGVFYLALESDGFDLARIARDEANELAGAQLSPATQATLAPLVPPAPPSDPVSFARAEVSAGKPYGMGRGEVQPLLGGSWTSSAEAFELGLRAGDLVGRRDLLVLGSLADAAPAGGGVAVAFRSKPIEFGARVYTSRERPSQERDAPFELAPIDLERTGLEVSAERTFSARSPLRLRGWIRLEEIESFGDTLSRRIGGASLALRLPRSRGAFRFRPELDLWAESGLTAGESFTRGGGRVGLGLGWLGHGELGLSARRDEARDVSQPFDLLRTGGTLTSFLPQDPSRLAVPALPEGALLGTDRDVQRVELKLDTNGLLGAPLFWERHRVRGSERQDFESWLSLAGVEWRWKLDPLPILRLPALNARIGIAQILATPERLESLDGELRGWVVLVWRP